MALTLCKTGPHRTLVNEKYGGTWHMWDIGGHRFSLVEYDDHIRLFWDYAADGDARFFGDTFTYIDVDNPTEAFAVEAFRMFETRGGHG